MTKPTSLKPFWRYYGGKWRAAPKYPQPTHSTIIEPFAGAAGYSMRYYERNVILIEKYPVLAEMWRFLIAASHDDIASIPLVDSVAELPDATPQGARYLIGFMLNDATVSPCNVLSAGKKRMRAAGHASQGWTEGRRARVAAQVGMIKHWKIIEGDYTDFQPANVTYFIDPPYNNKAGSCYVHSDINYESLGRWCMSLSGQVIVCENEGAKWLPFRKFATLRRGIHGGAATDIKRSVEVIWTND